MVYNSIWEPGAKPGSHLEGFYGILEAEAEAEAETEVEAGAEVTETAALLCRGPGELLLL